MEELRELIATEQVLRALPEGLRVWVQERKPKTAAEAGQLAEDYLQARRPLQGSKRMEVAGRRMDDELVRRCFECKQVGHLARDCPKCQSGWRAGGGIQKPRSELKCFSCGQKGHIAMRCPAKALFCGRQQQAGKPFVGAVGGMEVWRTGLVEGTQVADILLDTGCSRTLVRRDLVPLEKMRKGKVTIRCACGDTITYPLAEVEITVGGRQICLEAGASDTLPASVLLGVDVPEMQSLLRECCADGPWREKQVEKAWVVETRAQARLRERKAAVEKVKEMTSTARPTAIVRGSEEGEVERDASGEEVEGDASGGEVEGGDASGEVEGGGMDGEDTGMEYNFDQEIFQGGKERQRLTRREKRQDRHRYFQEEHARGEGVEMKPPELTAEELRKLQQEDPTLEMPRKLAIGEDASADGKGFFYRDGLLLRRWIPAVGCQDDQVVEQLVLPRACRVTVMKLAHNIPMAGHMGKTKTAKRIMQRFYWPTLHRDVADFCRGCSECQKAPSRRVQKAPLIPLPIMSIPFDRIAMDIVGPLPRSRLGNRYILVLCDYGTRCPEAVPLRNIDAEHVAEELVKVFARVGIPSEILTDQGTNFMSKLLSEVYRLLSVKAIRTSPYHPQTDGLVERFNQTLKAMLRKVADDDGKDWDRLLPYVLFAYREVPQASTGFSPFELLYGRPVRGPLDVLRETWEASSSGGESVVSYILAIRETLEKMTELVQENLSKAQKQQQVWYDRNARRREFQPGDRVLILLPTSSSKLLARWQGPYEVVRKCGKVNYEVKMNDRRKQRRVFHVNMLKEWHTPVESACVVIDSVEEDKEIVDWKEVQAVSEQEGPTIGEGLSDEQSGELREMLKEFADVMQDEPGRTNLIEHRIEVNGARPVRQAPYRIPYAYRELVQEEMKEMEEKGVIEKSSSEWASPIVLVGKKDGSMRLCVDFRRLNAVTQMDAYPMPRVDELIDKLGSACYITTLDLSRGYWQVPVPEESRPLTAFVTPFGQYQFRVMPFGLSGAPATFQRLMDQVKRGLEEFCAAYLDDVVLFSTTWEDHLTNVRMVLGRLRQAGSTAKPRKCQFGMAECVYLGHVVGGGVVRPLPSKVDAVASFPVPKTKKEVRTFLGLSGYYRRFIPEYARIATSLTDLTRKSAPNCIRWTSECQEAFQQLKVLLCSGPVLKSPDFSREFVLQTDASERGVGAVLSQVDDLGEDHPVAYYSRKLLPREENYSTVEKECLGIKLGVNAFRVYLLGRRFVVQTDHRCLEWLDRAKFDNPRLTQWYLSLQPYHFTVQHRPGSANGNADALSQASVTGLPQEREEGV